MSDSDGKVLTGLARSIDSLFLAAGHPPAGSKAAAVDDALADLNTSNVDTDSSLSDLDTSLAGLEVSDGHEDDGPDTVEMEAIRLDGFDTHVGGDEGSEEEDDPLPELEVVEAPLSAPIDLDPAFDPEPAAADGDAAVTDGDAAAPEPEAAAVDMETATADVEAAAERPTPMPDVAAPESADDDFIPTALDLAVDAYLEGDRSRADEIDTLGREHMASKDVDAVARSVERIVLAAGLPKDEGVYAVAESLMYPLALDRVVRHMGLERDEAVRRDFYAICRSIGEPITPAIRNELGETNTDRLARRIYCEALTEMGDAGSSMIREMVESDNQFLVRNAVSILGDHGGENAVELVTSALGNPDRRVRREALKALAKLGDEKSGEVVIGFLEDPDEKVRLAAAVACGELKVGRALRPLVAMLDEEKDPDKAILIIRALGHLGDPGAVLSLEKHAVRTMFSRPRTDVRIAAYRALHQIGTPKTRQMLLGVAKDKDEDVKDAVKKMLYG